VTFSQSSAQSEIRYNTARAKQTSQSDYAAELQKCYEKNNRKFDAYVMTSFIDGGKFFIRCQQEPFSSGMKRQVFIVVENGRKSEKTSEEFYKILWGI